MAAQFWKDEQDTEADQEDEEHASADGKGFNDRQHRLHPLTTSRGEPS